MWKIAAFLMATGFALNSVAADEPGTRKRLSPEETRSQTEQVRPSSPNIENRGDPTKGTHGYGEPSDPEGKNRVGNSETPGTTDQGKRNYYSR
jgi:hypothetical protein